MRVDVRVRVSVDPRGSLGAVERIGDCYGVGGDNVASRERQAHLGGVSVRLGQAHVRPVELSGPDQRVV